jgi:hypothetical protein
LHIMKYEKNYSARLKWFSAKKQSALKQSRIKDLLLLFS